MWIDYDKVHFNINWNEVKGNQLIWQGNEREGVLIIADKWGKIIKMWGYETINEMDGDE